ncbi:MAG: carbonic anhydrase [Coxiellaceae bacterium]|nr:carbonic anhydrase [Coxiellaceae bacterium]
MRNLLTILSATVLSCSVASLYAADQAKPANPHLVTAETQKTLSAEDVLTQLKQGNQRYTKGETVKYNQRQLSQLASHKGQAPYAFIFNCVDSRSVPEVVFDQPVGAMFVSRIAGNVIGTDVLGSMEFSTKYAGSKLVVIMGHTQCGAVAGACSKVNKPAQLNKLLMKIDPAVQQIAKQHKAPLDCKNMTEVNQIAKQNVLNQMRALLQNSKSLAKMVDQHKILLVGAMHDIKTGQVDFFNIDGSKK